MFFCEKWGGESRQKVSKNSISCNKLFPPRINKGQTLILKQNASLTSIFKKKPNRKNDLADKLIFEIY